MSRLARALITFRSVRARVVEEMFIWKLTKNYIYLEILVPYPNTTSEETIFESDKIKKQHERRKLQNGKVMLRNATNPD